MNSLEVGARAAWAAWAAWAKFTVCRECGEPAYCGARRRSGPYLCLPCLDVSAEAVRAARHAKERRKRKPDAAVVSGAEQGDKRRARPTS
jgi:hypothetical protein